MPGRRLFVAVHRAVRSGIGVAVLALFSPGAAAATQAAEATAVRATAAAAPAPGEFQTVLFGPVVDVALGSAAVGDSLLGDLGGEYLGLQSLRDRRWLLQWDTLVAARGGTLANTHPFTGLLGLRTAASAELGHRWLRRGALALYAGGRLDGELSVLTRPGTPIDRLDTINSVDGVGGVVGSGAVRVDVGLSELDTARSLLIVGFFQEALRAPGIVTPGGAFAEGGVSARFDLTRRLTAWLEALAGQSTPRTDAALGTRDQTTVIEVAGAVRAIFRRNMWLTASGSIGQELDRRTYQGSAAVYRTASPPSLQGTLAYGMSFDDRIFRKRGGGR